MKRVLAGLALAGLLACSDSTEPSGGNSVTFTYTGAGNGTFSASGAAPSLTAPPPSGTSWAMGFMEGSETFVWGSTPRSGDLINLALVRLELTTVGSVSIDPACNIDGGTPCTGMEFYLNFNGDGDTGDFFCGLTSGTIALTEVSVSRVKGTFSGTGECISGTGGAGTAFVVSDGAFDVALVAPPG